MCGIAGILTSDPSLSSSIHDSVRVMTESVTHRGPDDDGIWTDLEAGVALGFRRLAIIDLSAHGHQPMASSRRRYTIVFNGEIYNYRSLRKELEARGCGFRGHSDTEVILASFEHWGVPDTVRRLRGMFAIAAWDGERRRLWLMRDRLGIKPLYYYHRPGLLTFGSELKALASGPEFTSDIDRNALRSYLRYLYIPAPASIYHGVHKLLPGHFLEVGDVAGQLPGSRAYWSLGNVARSGLAHRSEASDAEAIEQLDQLLGDAVASHMQSDVPLGALLSGGIDSSTVVALMQRASSRAVKTFTIGFTHKEHDEAVHAARIARHLGTDHTDLRVDGEAALAVVPRLADLFDEPLADPSQIPTHLVCALARQQVTVALSGDGGDEVFSGYHRYTHGEPWIRRLSAMPRSLRLMAAAAITSVRAESWDGAYRMISRALPGQARHRLAGEKAHKLAALMRWDSQLAMYDSLHAAWQKPEDVLQAGRPVNGTTGIEASFHAAAELPLLDRMMLADQQSYLPDDLLAKVDRASMAVSLEVRVPLLDHEVVEFAWHLPRRHRIRSGRGKWLLRQVLDRYVPSALIDRPKMGFTVPISAWLQGPLRPWAEDMLTTQSFTSNDFFDVGAVDRAWRRFQAGDHALALGIWAILMFEAWRCRWGVIASGPIGHGI